MSRFLSSILLFLLPGAVLAAKELEAQSAPVETVGTIYIIIFGIIFIGMIVGFFVYLWMSEDKKSAEDK